MHSCHSARRCSPREGSGRKPPKQKPTPNIRPVERSAFSFFLHLGLFRCAPRSGTAPNGRALTRVVLPGGMKHTTNSARGGQVPLAQILRVRFLLHTLLQIEPSTL